MSDTSKLGQLLDETAQRDAIHIALAPVTSPVTLKPGTHVGLLPDGRVSPGASPKVGIVDPFLTEHVQPGQRFWLCLYQQTITALRHRWEHPAFASEPEPAVPPTVKRGVSLGGVPPYVPPPEIQDPPPASALSAAARTASEDWLRSWCAAHDCPDYASVLRVIRDGHIPGDSGDGYGGATYGPDYISFYGAGRARLHPAGVLVARRDRARPSGRIPAVVVHVLVLKEG